MSDILPPIELAGSIWFHSGAVNWGNPRRMALLAAIQEQGSISAAARQINLSYKAAWDAVHTINSLSPEPLIICTTGGSRGGGASLSPQAEEILTLYQQMQNLHEQFLQHLAQLRPGSPENLELLSKMLVHTSARNSLAGTITHIEADDLHALLTLKAENGPTVQAAITSASCRHLELTPGGPALAFIKASALRLHYQQPAPEAADNIFAGKLVDWQQSDEYLQVRLALNAHLELTVIQPKSTLGELGLYSGQALWASCAAEHVLIGRSELPAG